MGPVDRRSPALTVHIAPESSAQTVRRLQAEAKEAAHLHMSELGIALARVVRLAREVSEGGDIYPAGVRDLCRRLSDDVDLKAQTLEALMARRPC